MFESTLVESLSQQIGEEPVIAIPAPLVIQRDDEQVGAFEVFQRCLPGTSGSEQHGFTQEPHRRSRIDVRNKNVWMLRRLLMQHFFQQIVEHEMMAAGERPDEAGGIRSALHGERGQLQTGDPAFGAILQRGDVVR